MVTLTIVSLEVASYLPRDTGGSDLDPPEAAAPR